MAAIGLAFVDIVGDTSRTGAQIERDLNREIDFVEETIDPVQIDMALADGTAAHLRDVVEADLASIGEAVQAINVNASLDPDTRARINHQLQVVAQSLRGAREDLRIGIAEEQIVEETVAAVEEAVHVAELVAPPIEIETRIDHDVLERTARDFSGIGGAAKGALGPIAGIGGALLGLGGAAQGAFAVVSTIKLIAPAAALAAPAIVAVGAAMGAVKLASVGIEDAITTALDPSNPEKFNKALKGLSPEAQKFAKAVQELQPAFKDLQQSVQNKVFEGLGGVLKGVAHDVLPTLKTGLVGVGAQLNAMALSTASAASELARNGTLGKALDGATGALAKFSDVPGIAVSAFGQLAAAAAPALDRVATTVSGKIANLGGDLTASFESGGLGKAIDAALDQVISLIHVIGNLGKIFANVTSTAEGFKGVVGILEKVTGAIADLTATDQAQHAFQSLFGVVNNLTSEALPVLVDAIKAVGDVVIALAPGVNAILDALGPALQEIIGAAAPVLASLAGAVGKLFIAFSPLITAAGDLIARILPVLTPAFDSLSRIFTALAPVVSQVADLFVSFLSPILERLPGIMEPILNAYAQLAEKLFPVVLDLLTQLSPSFDELQRALLDVFTALSPVIQQVADLAGKIFDALLPFIKQLIPVVANLAAIFADELSTTLETVVLPALRAVSDFLKGDFRGALDNVEQLLVGLAEEIGRQFLLIPARIIQAFEGLFLDMLRIGAGIIDSLIDGIKSGIGKLGNVLGNVTDYIREHKGPIEKDRTLLTPAGQAIMSGLRDGIADGIPALGAQLGGITGMVAGMGLTMPSLGGPSGLSGLSANTLAQGGVTIPTVQVFVGTREITDIVDVRVAQSNRQQARQLTTGVRG